MARLLDSPYFWPVTGFLAAAGLFVLSKKSAVTAPGPAPVEPVQEGQNELRAVLQAAGLDNEWIIYFEGTAAGESGFNNLVARGVTSGAPEWAKVVVRQHDADMAKVAYDRNVKRYGPCLWPQMLYTFGSGGWFQFLPANGLAAFWGTELECMHPWNVFDPAASVVMAIEMARRLMKKDNFKANPTWLNLRVGWGGPGNMNNPESLKRMATGHNKFGDRLEQIGIDPSFMHRPVTALIPKDPASLYSQLEKL